MGNGCTEEVTSERMEFHLVLGELGDDGKDRLILAFSVFLLRVSIQNS